ncbi:MAG TPA: pyridoxamine 5'-phosphate oxidase family protein [Acidimicrobiales bacterium]|nr:pyridoxamine 5'-phosphate oxidase family protein [Acidimicrobiales bacterium]
MPRREITRTECLDLIARTSVGRVALVVGALPEIVPVNFQVAGETVVFGVHSASVLAQDLEGTVVAFQVDSFDTERECGWHVHAIGTLGEVLGADELAVAGAVVPPSWTRGEEVERVVQIELTVVSGYVVEAPETRR